MHPPQHSVTAEIEFVSRTDPAWDRDRVNSELDEMTDEEGQQHPFVQYQAGATRYDLDALGKRPGDGDELVEARTRDYFKPEVQPRVFKLRRLKAAQVSRCLDIGGRTGEKLACQLGLREVDPPIRGLKLKGRERPLSEDELQKIADALGVDTVWEVGAAALEASRLPTEQEKKASGS